MRKSIFNKFSILAAALCMLLGFSVGEKTKSVNAAAPENQTHYVTKTLSADRKTCIWDYATPTTEATDYGKEIKLYDVWDSDLYYVKSTSGSYPKYKYNDGYLSAKDGYIYIPVPSDAAGTISMDYYDTGSNSHKFSLYINNSEDPNKALWAKLYEEGNKYFGTKGGYRHFDFTSSDLSTLDVDPSGDKYIKLYANNSMKPTSFKIVLTSGTFPRDPSSLPYSTFHSNGGLFPDGTDSIKVVQEEETTVSPVCPSVPTKAGYTFMGWSESPTSSTVVSSLEFLKDYYAVWAEIQVDTITLESTNIAFDENKTYQLKWTCLPENASNKTVTFTSSNPAIASVDANGLITGHEEGQVVITLTAGNAVATCNVTLNHVEQYTVTFNFGTGFESQNVVVYNGEVVKKVADPSNPGYVLVKWVLADGQEYNFDTPVTSNITLTAVWEELHYADKVVLDAPEEGIYLNPGVETRLTYTLSRTDGQEVNVFTPVVWNSSNTNVVTINEDGLIVITGTGQSDVSVTLYEGQFQITSQTIRVYNNNAQINGEWVDKSLDIEYAKGTFEVPGGDSEIAVRFVFSVNKSYVKYIRNAFMTVESISSTGTVLNHNKHTITMFYEEIAYQSAQPGGDLATPWTSEGRVGMALTIHGISKFGFRKGTFKCTFEIREDIHDGQIRNYETSETFEF